METAISYDLFIDADLMNNEVVTDGQMVSGGLSVVPSMKHITNSTAVKESNFENQNIKIVEMSTETANIHIVKFENQKSKSEIKNIENEMLKGYFKLLSNFK